MNFAGDTIQHTRYLAKKEDMFIVFLIIWANMTFSEKVCLFLNFFVLCSVSQHIYIISF